MQSVLITGVSTGIGHGMTRVLTKFGIEVFGSVRSKEDGDRLEEEFGDCFHALIMDVRDQESIDRAKQEVSRKLAGRMLWALVNNAGISILGPFLFQPLEEFSSQMDVNLLGTVRVIKTFLPLLGTNPEQNARLRKKIINVSSMGGKMGVPLLSGYTASKYAIEGLSESLRRELQPLGIDVVIVGPGAVNTKIFDKALETNFARYANTPYSHSLRAFTDRTQSDRRNAIAPDEVGDLLLKILHARKPRARYSIMRHGWILGPLLSVMPTWVMDAMFAKLLRIGAPLTGDGAMAAMPD